MFYQTLLSPQVKRSAIISNKLGIYQLLHELVNDLRRVRILRGIGLPENEQKGSDAKKIFKMGRYTKKEGS